jgi:putative membrane protein
MQIRRIRSAVVCFALFAAAGIAYAASVSKADKQFMIMAARNDMIEAHEAQMAESQAERTDVKNLAKTLVQDHTESYRHLSELGAKTGVSIPKGIDAAKDPAVQQLTRLKGGSFDRQFARDEIAAHRHVIAVFKHEAEHGQDPEVKAYASKVIPVLEKHLHLAEECAKVAKHS